MSNERCRPDDLSDPHCEGDPQRERGKVVIEWTACVDHFNFWLAPQNPEQVAVVVWFPEQDSPPTNFAAILTSVQMRALASLLSGRPETEVYPIFVRKDFVT